jgi:hypothetical protein
VADATQLLKDLRPLHAVSAVSDAMPVIVMGLLGCAAALVLIFFFMPWLRRRRILRASALNKLAKTRTLPSAERLAAQAAILRSIVKALSGSTAAHARGAEWLDSLDATFSTRFFSSEQGQVFSDPLYRSSTAFDIEAMDRALAAFFTRIDR